MPIFNMNRHRLQFFGDILWLIIFFKWKICDDNKDGNFLASKINITFIRDSLIVIFMTERLIIQHF